MRRSLKTLHCFLSRNNQAEGSGSQGNSAAVSLPGAFQTELLTPSIKASVSSAQLGEQPTEGAVRGH